MSLNKLLYGVAIIAGLTATSASAQTITNNEARLSLAGNYIGVHLSVLGTAMRCNYNLERAYSPRTAVDELKAFMRPDELRVLEDFLDSDDLLQSRRQVESNLDQEFQALQSQQGLDKMTACQVLIQNVLANYQLTERSLEGLR
ncbi:hypothetical protein ACFL12_02100 [Pseudomonadota bacterium]